MSNLDDYRNSKKEMFDSRKQKYNISDNSPTINQSNIYKPNGFKKKLENYWYHYKWITIILLFIGIFISGFIYTMLTRPIYDASLTIVSKNDYFYAHEYINKELSRYLNDNSNDDKIDINLQILHIDPLGDNNIHPSALMANTAKLMGTINSGSSFLYILDEESYDFLVSQGVVFINLEDITNKDNITGQKLYLKDTNIIKNNNLDFLSDKFFAIIDLNSYSNKDATNPKKISSFNNEIDFLNNIISYNY